MLIHKDRGNFQKMVVFTQLPSVLIFTKSEEYYSMTAHYGDFQTFPGTTSPLRHSCYKFLNIINRSFLSFFSLPVFHPPFLSVTIRGYFSGLSFSNLCRKTRDLGPLISRKQVTLKGPGEDVEIYI